MSWLDVKLTQHTNKHLEVSQDMKTGEITTKNLCQGEQGNLENLLNYGKKSIIFEILSIAFTEQEKRGIVRKKKKIITAREKNMKSGNVAKAHCKIHFILFFFVRSSGLTGPMKLG